MQNWTHSKEHLDSIRIKSIKRSKELKAERIAEYNKNPQLCKYCGKPLSYEKVKQGNQFCNQSCGAKYNNKKRTQEKLGDIKENRYCINCGKLIPKRKNESWQRYMKKEYCCSDCKISYYRNSLIDNWKNGIYDGNSGDDLNDIIREYIINKAGNKCSICGWNKMNTYTNKIPLEVHHIDGNPYNNKENNLQVLCPNCHSLTNNFKGNRGRGRFNRRKAYASRQKELKDLLR